MKNKKGQSLVDVIFSIGIIVLVLTGVVVLVVSTAKIKRINSQRQKAVELSQLLIEDKISEIKDDPSTFWNSAEDHVFNSENAGNFGEDFVGYTYVLEQKNCNDHNSCDIIFNISWEDGTQSLSVKRLFLKNGI